MARTTSSIKTKSALFEVHLCILSGEEPVGQPVCKTHCYYYSGMLHGLSIVVMTIFRIQLKSHTIDYAGQPQINLCAFASLTFLFSEKGTDEIEIDEVEFSN